MTRSTKTLLTLALGAALVAGAGGYALAQAGDLPLHLRLGDVEAEDLRAAGFQTDGAADGDAAAENGEDGQDFFHHGRRVYCSAKLTGSDSTL